MFIIRILLTHGLIVNLDRSNPSFSVHIWKFSQYISDLYNKKSNLEVTFGAHFYMLSAYLKS